MQQLVTRVKKSLHYRGVALYSGDEYHVHELEGDGLLFIPKGKEPEYIETVIVDESLKRLPLSDRFRKVRESMGMSQRDMASVCGVTQAEISVLERGTSSMGYDTMMKIKKGLQLDWGFFEE